jgi:hypothetical protein
MHKTLSSAIQIREREGRGGREQRRKGEVGEKLIEMREC